MERQFNPNQKICGEQFVVSRADDLSLNDLLELQKTDSVTRTPHIGNLYSGSLLWTAAGGRSIFYDNTIGGRDKNFHPSRIIDGQSRLIAPENTLVRNTSAFEGQRLSDVHMRAVNKRFPHAEVVTYEQYQQLNNDLIVGILDCISESSDIPLERFASRTGEISATQTFYDSAKNIIGLNNHETGYILPNAMNAFLSGVVESILFQKQTIYHLSGPDMITYIKEFGPTLDRWYAALQSSPRFASLLPKKLDFRLVPAASAKLVVPQSFAQDLDILVDGQSERSRIKQSYGLKIKTANKTEREALILERRIIEKELYRDLGIRALNLSKVLFDDYKNPNRKLPSQYSPGELYIHQSSLSLPAKDTIELMKDLTSTYEYAKAQNEI